MYRRRRSNSRSMLVLSVALGLVGAVVFMLHEWGWSPSLVPLPAVQPSASPVVLLPTSVAVMSTPQATAEPLPEVSLFIPTIGVLAPVVELPLSGTNWNVTYLGASNVGHLWGTAALATAGNTVLVGHVETSDGGGGVFRALPSVAIGDPIVLQVDGQEHRYVTTQAMTVASNDLRPLSPVSHGRLTLITCEGYDFLSDTYRWRYVVTADLLA